MSNVHVPSFTAFLAEQRKKRKLVKAATKVAVSGADLTIPATSSDIPTKLAGTEETGAGSTADVTPTPTEVEEGAKEVPHTAEKPLEPRAPAVSSSLGDMDILTPTSHRAPIGEVAPEVADDILEGSARGLVRAILGEGSGQRHPEAGPSASLLAEDSFLAGEEDEQATKRPRLGDNTEASVPTLVAQIHEAWSSKLGEGATLLEPEVIQGFGALTQLPSEETRLEGQDVRSTAFHLMADSLRNFSTAVRHYDLVRRLWNENLAIRREGLDAVTTMRDQHKKIKALQAEVASLRAQEEETTRLREQVKGLQTELSQEKEKSEKIFADLAYARGDKKKEMERADQLALELSTKETQISQQLEIINFEKGKRKELAEEVSSLKAEARGIRAQKEKGEAEAEAKIATLHTNWEIAKEEVAKLRDQVTAAEEVRAGMAEAWNMERASYRVALLRKARAMFPEASLDELALLRPESTLGVVDYWSDDDRLFPDLPEDEAASTDPPLAEGSDAPPAPPPGSPAKDDDVPAPSMGLA